MVMFRLGKLCVVLGLFVMVALSFGLTVLAEGVDSLDEGWYGKFKTFVTCERDFQKSACGMWLRNDRGTLCAIYKAGTNENPYVAAYPGKTGSVRLPYAMFYDETTGELTLQVPIDKGKSAKLVTMEKVERLILADQ